MLAGGGLLAAGVVASAVAARVRPCSRRAGCGLTAMRASGRFVRWTARGIAQLTACRPAPGPSGRLAIALGVRGTPREAHDHLELGVAIRGADTVGHDGVAP